jgi:hypothetical protein
MRVHIERIKGSIVAIGLVAAATCGACSGDAQAMDASEIDKKYDIAGASDETISTADGPVKGTLVPITLANGRQGQLFIPQKQSRDPHPVYLRDDQGLHPVALKERTTRAEIASAPAIIETKAEPAHADKRSWEKEALIIGGSAGAGTAIGAMAGGKKGAAVGAAAGGVGGLIYDLMTRKKK